MDITQLTYFKTVCKEKSFSKAAKQLYISPQGINKAIHKLENELGISLFEITSDGLYLTEPGAILYSHVDEYILQHQIIIDEIETFKKQSENSLTIGIKCGFSDALGRDFLTNFVVQNPSLHIRIHSYQKEILEQAMQQPEVKVWICPGDYDQSSFKSIFEHKVRMFLLVGETHPLANQTSVKVAELAHYPLISLSSDIGQQFAMNYMHESNQLHTPDFLLDASDRKLIMQMIQSGSAVSFNSGWHYKEYPGIKRIELEDFHVDLQVNVLIRKAACHTRALQCFIDYCKEVLPQKVENI